VLPTKFRFIFAKQFQRRFLEIDQCKTRIACGSHVGFPISAKNTNLVYDHPMNISAKFGSNLFCGFRKKDENVKFPSFVGP
jgi:hypothetical protein